MPSASRAPLVAIVTWGALIEDFLDTIGVSIDAFCSEMTGGYLFNYVDALGSAGVRSIIVLISGRVVRPTRMKHVGTGATVLVLPPPTFYRVLRFALRSRLGRHAAARMPRLGQLLREIASYTATPPRAFVRELRREGCDALLCQEYEFTRFDVCTLLAKRLGIPLFATFQGGNYRWGRLQHTIRPLTMRRCAGFVIGPRLEVERVQALERIPDERIARVFNPLDAHAFNATPRAEARAALGILPDARVAIWYGRVERGAKGIDVLMDAWEQVCRERPHLDLHLLMIGTGSDAGWLHGRLTKSGLRGVRWRDEYIHDRSVLRLHLSAADVFAFPSRHEGFPVAPIEAMACGLAVVAADAPGVPDILEGGEAVGGVVVPKGDVAEFARALGRVLDDPAWGRQLGDCARRRAEEHFSLESVGRQLRDFLMRRGLPSRGRAPGKVNNA